MALELSYERESRWMPHLNWSYLSDHIVRDYVEETEDDDDSESTCSNDLDGLYQQQQQSSCISFDDAHLGSSGSIEGDSDSGFNCVVERYRQERRKSFNTVATATPIAKQQHQHNNRNQKSALEVLKSNKRRKNLNNKLLRNNKDNNIHFNYNNTNHNHSNNNNQSAANSYTCSCARTYNKTPTSTSAIVGDYYYHHNCNNHLRQQYHHPQPYHQQSTSCYGTNNNDNDNESLQVKSGKFKRTKRAWVTISIILILLATLICLGILASVSQFKWPAAITVGSSFNSAQQQQMATAPVLLRSSTDTPAFGSKHTISAPVVGSHSGSSFGSSFGASGNANGNGNGIAQHANAKNATSSIAAAAATKVQ